MEPALFGGGVDISLPSGVSRIARHSVPTKTHKTEENEELSTFAGRRILHEKTPILPVNIRFAVDGGRASDPTNLRKGG